MLAIVSLSLAPPKLLKRLSPSMASLSLSQGVSSSSTGLLEVAWSTGGKVFISGDYIMLFLTIETVMTEDLSIASSSEIWALKLMSSCSSRCSRPDSHLASLQRL